MHTNARRLLGIILPLTLSISVSVADEELPWRGYDVTDQPTGKLIYGVTKSYLVSVDDDNQLERRIGFQCIDGMLVLTFDLGDFLLESSTDFELLLWIDEAESVGLDMRVWSNSTSGGYSRVEAIAADVFARMIAGTRLYWRISQANNNPDGTFSLIGFTAASRQLATNCSLTTDA